MVTPNPANRKQSEHEVPYVYPDAAENYKDSSESFSRLNMLTFGSLPWRTVSENGKSPIAATVIHKVEGERLGFGLQRYGSAEVL